MRHLAKQLLDMFGPADSAKCVTACILNILLVQKFLRERQMQIFHAQ